MDRFAQHDCLVMAGRRILVVDDSREIVSVIEDILRADGVRVSSAYNGHDAMAMLGEERFDAVILDLTMPKPNGWDVLEFIGKTIPHMLARTTILTGMCYDREIARTLKSKGIAHLFKPFDIDSLRKTVCALLKVELPVSA
ncbi:MAG: response regulator [Phycisphaerae bacterium]|nr:response regulator [Phycisphaerae bacterium]